LTLEDARRLIQIYVDHYHTVRLHGAIGYVTPLVLGSHTRVDFGATSKTNGLRAAQ
jgi:hypothetical protein